MAKGLVYVFTGDGKGKTSASLGVAVRALAAGMKVAMVQWYKQKEWRISEHGLPEMFQDKYQGRFEIIPLGKGFHIAEPTREVKQGSERVKMAEVGKGSKVWDTASDEEHRKAAVEALKTAEKLMPQVDVLVMDEVNNAVADGLIKLDELTQIMMKRGRTHLILTGRNVDPKIVELADLVSEIKKVKHPYDQGTLAVKGLDF